MSSTERADTPAGSTPPDGAMDAKGNRAPRAIPGKSMPDRNATGAGGGLPDERPGTAGRETQEREAALARGRRSVEGPDHELSPPDVPGLPPELAFSLLADNVRDYAIFLMDADGIIRYWGEGARLMKWWTRQEAEGAHLRILYMDGGSDDGTAESHLEIAAQRGEYTGEGNRVRSDGSTFWAGVTLTGLRNARGELVGFSKVTRDFSARRAVEATLLHQASSVELQRLVEETAHLKMLVASVSHELRAPLNAMLGYVALLERDIGERAPERTYIEKLRRSGRHLVQIISDVLDLARFEGATLPILRSANRLGPAIEEALGDIELHAEARGITVTNAVSGGASDLPYVGDESRVRRILVNLLTNAIKFTEPGGCITVSGGTGQAVVGADLAGPGPWVYVRVEDTGRGIPPERLNAIFEPYQQAEAADRDHGTGLGLSISRDLARRMGGDLTADSQGETGASFTLWLPMASADPVPR